MRMTLSELAKAVAGELTGNGNIEITRIVHPADAEGPGDFAIAMDKRYLQALATSKATSAIVSADAEVPANITSFIRVPWAKRALVELTNLFSTPTHFEPGISPQAAIDKTARIGKNVSVGPFCYVGPEAVIGDDTVLQAQVYVGKGASIGSGGFIFSGARIMDKVQIGARAIIHPNAVIGGDGFSFVSAEKGSVEAFKEGRSNTGGNAHLLRIASIGPVIIGDDVEIGSGTTIDRATIRTTRIGSGTKIDNQVQVGHNATIGSNVMICGQAGIAGSSIIGDRAVLAASSGIADNVQVGEDAIVGATAGVAGNVPARSVVMGTPAIPRERFQDLILAQARLPRLMKQVEEMKAQIKKLQEGLEPDAETA